MNLAKMRKALVAATGALITALVFALTDGELSSEDIGGILTAVLATGGVTWRVPNANVNSGVRANIRP